MSDNPLWEIANTILLLQGIFELLKKSSSLILLL